MTKHFVGHKLIMKGPPGFLSEALWQCECGAWSSKTPALGPFGRSTAKARIAQVQMAHGKHARNAARLAAKAT